MRRREERPLSLVESEPVDPLDLPQEDGKTEQEAADATMRAFAFAGLYLVAAAVCVAIIIAVWPL